MVQEGEQGAPVGGRMTTGQRIRMEARAEGRMDGRLEQAQRTLLRILKRRFGSVAVLAEPWFQKASLLHLEGWIQRALDAPVLEAVFEDRFCTLFSVAFSLPQVAASWIRSLESSQRGPRVDWSTLGIIREVTLTTGLGLRLEQPVFEVQLSEGVGCVVFAPECQGASNRTAAESVRAFLCIAQEWRGEIGERLPALVPVLLRRDSLGVRTERPAHRVVAWHEETRRMLEVADPKSETWVDDLAGLTEQGLRARGLHPLATLVLLAYRFLPELGDAEASLEAFSRWQDLLEADMQGVGTQDVAAVLAALGRYMLEVTELAEPQLPRLLREPLDARTGVGMTTGDRIRLEVRKELWEQAVAFGRETQARTALVRLVERRFGADPSAIRAQLAGTSLQKLEVWLERVPEARTLSDLFDAE